MEISIRITVLRPTLHAPNLNKFDLAKIRTKVGRKKEAPKTNVFPKPWFSTTKPRFYSEPVFFSRFGGSRYIYIYIIYVCFVFRVLSIYFEFDKFLSYVFAYVIITLDVIGLHVLITQHDAIATASRPLERISWGKPQLG